jgi:polysaccharide pyruvyl transferase CsaB
VESISVARHLRVGISGSYGGLNLGDEAILEAILGQLREAATDMEVTVFSRDARDTLDRHRVEHVVDVRTMTRKEITHEVKCLDLLILGGGGILYDREAETYLREVFVAHEYGIPVMLYAISAGPLTSRASRQAVREALNASTTTLITVRDRLAYRLLEDVGVTQDIHLTADPAFLLEPDRPGFDALEAEGVRLDKHLVGFSVREPGPAAPHINPEKYYALLANTADFIVDQYDADVVFVPMEKTDVQHSHAVVSHMRAAGRAEILRREYTARQILHIIGRFHFAVGMRLHFLMFAALQGTPFAALPYASKVTGLVEDLGMDTPPLGRIGVGQLIASIDRSWDTRDEVRTRIEQRLPALLARAAQSRQLLDPMLRPRPREAPIPPADSRPAPCTPVVLEPNVVDGESDAL